MIGSVSCDQIFHLTRITNTNPYTVTAADLIPIMLFNQPYRTYRMLAIQLHTTIWHIVLRMHSTSSNAYSTIQRDVELQFCCISPVIVVYATVNVPFGFRDGVQPADSQLPIISMRGANFTKCFTSQFSMATRAPIPSSRGIFGGIFATISIGARLLRNSASRSLLCGAVAKRVFLGELRLLHCGGKIGKHPQLVQFGAVRSQIRSELRYKELPRLSRGVESTSLYKKNVSLPFAFAIHEHMYIHWLEMVCRS